MSKEEIYISLLRAKENIALYNKEKSKDKTSEKQAKKTAVKQFKELGETTKEDELQIMKIQRKGEEYYYVTSKENTLEIKISTGKVTRINSVIVEE